MKPARAWATTLLLAIASTNAEALAFDAVTLLSRDSPDEMRRAELVKLRNAAEGNDVQAACLLGRLGMRYRETEQLNLAHHRIVKNFPRHLKKAFPELIDGDYGNTSSLLEKCALGGDIDSYLNLAVYALRLSEYRQALVWSGVYLSLGERLCAQTMARREGILEETIEQARAKLPERKVSDAEIFNEVQRYLTTNAVEITAGHREKAFFDITKVGFTINVGLSAVIARKILENSTSVRGINTRGASATFVVEVGERGKVRQVLVIDALPNFHRASFFAERIAVSYPAPQDSSGNQFAWVAAGADEQSGYSVSDPGCRFDS